MAELAKSWTDAMLTSPAPFRPDQATLSEGGKLSKGGTRFIFVLYFLVAVAAKSDIDAIHLIGQSSAFALCAKIGFNLQSPQCENWTLELVHHNIPFDEWVICTRAIKDIIAHHI